MSMTDKCGTKNYIIFLQGIGMYLELFQKKKKKLEFSLQFFNRNSDKIIPLIILGSQTSKFVCVDSSSKIQVQKTDAFNSFFNVVVAIIQSFFEMFL